MKSKILLTALFSSLLICNNNFAIITSSSIEGHSLGAQEMTVSKTDVVNTQSSETQTEEPNVKQDSPDKDTLPLTQPDPIQTEDENTDGQNLSQMLRESIKDIGLGSLGRFNINPTPEPIPTGIETSCYYDKSTGKLDFKKNVVYRLVLSDLEKEYVNSFCYRIQNGKEINDFIYSLSKLFENNRNVISGVLLHGWMLKNLDQIKLLADTFEKERERTPFRGFVVNKFTNTFRVISNIFNYVEIIFDDEKEINTFFEKIIESAEFLVNRLKDKVKPRCWDDNFAGAYISTFCNLFFLYQLDDVQRDDYNAWVPIDIKNFTTNYETIFKKISLKIPLDNMRYLGYLDQLFKSDRILKSDRIINLLKGYSLEDFLDKLIVMSKAIDRTMYKSPNPTDEELDEEFFSSFYDNSYIIILNQVCHNPGINNIEEAVQNSDKCFKYFSEKKSIYDKGFHSDFAWCFEMFCYSIRERAKNSFLPDQILNSAEKLLELFFEWLEDFSRARQFNELRIFHKKDEYDIRTKSMKHFIKNLAVSPLDHAVNILYDVFGKDLESWRMFKKVLAGFDIVCDLDSPGSSDDLRSITEDFIRFFSDASVSVKDIPLTLTAAMILPYAGTDFKITHDITESISNVIRHFRTKGPLFAALQSIISIVGCDYQDPIIVTENTTNSEILNNITCILKSTMQEEKEETSKLLDNLMPYVENILNYRGKNPLSEN